MILAVYIEEEGKEGIFFYQFLTLFNLPKDEIQCWQQRADKCKIHSNILYLQL